MNMDIGPDLWHLWRAIVISAVAIIVYFIPTWIATARKHHNADAIFVTNLLLGWTAIGWIVALIWSLTAVKRESSNNIEIQHDLKQCPFCAEKIKSEAKVCRYCGRDLLV
jgi:uncharacterized membrane protein YhaH (DUF805 family)